MDAVAKLAGQWVRLNKREPKSKNNFEQKEFLLA